MSKRMTALKKALDTTKVYSALEAFALLKQHSKVKFTESVDVSVNLGIDYKKSDQVVRGAADLPKGTGKVVRVAAFVPHEHQKTALAAGADVVGFEDLADTIKKGQMDFDILIATPDAMRLVGQLGPILGPRGLMPNPKVGTVTTDVAGAIRKSKAGQARYRNDKAGIIHCRIGTVEFSPEDLKENLEALIKDLRKMKPQTSKGVYLRKLTISSTMGPGLVVDLASVDA